MAKIKLHIGGMHCISCEILLEKGFEGVEGIESCEVSHKKGSLEIECGDEVSLADITEVVEKSGYQVVVEQEKHLHKAGRRNGGSDYFQVLLIALGVFGVVFLIGKFEISRLFPEFGSNFNVFIALVLGVVASLSTCLALVGGIVMGFGNLYPVHEDRRHRFMSRAWPHIYFHIGRVGGFMLLGGLLGLLGSKINYSLSFAGYLTIVIAFLMFYIGLQILDVVPNITKLGFHLPKFLSKKIHSLEKSGHPLMPIILGALTFFLPCGFTQTMQLASVASKSFISGSLIMGAFALGTVPVLIAVGIGSTYAKKEKSGFFTKLIGVVIVFFALYSLNSGLILSGSSFTIDFWRSSGGTVSSTISGDSQIIQMDVDWSFSPTEFKIKKGIPVRWKIDGINVSGCSNEIVIPKLGIREQIGQGLNVVEFTPEEEGVFPFSCWMGMLNGRIIVE